MPVLRTFNRLLSFFRKCRNIWLGSHHRHVRSLCRNPIHDFYFNSRQPRDHSQRLAKMRNNRNRRNMARSEKNVPSASTHSNPTRKRGLVPIEGFSRCSASLTRRVTVTFFPNEPYFARNALLRSGYGRRMRAPENAHKFFGRNVTNMRIFNTHLQILENRWEKKVLATDLAGNVAGKKVPLFC